MCFSEASKAAIGWRMNGFGELDWGAFSLDYDLLQLVNGAAVTHSSYSFSFLICKGFPDEWKQEKCFTQNNFVPICLDSKLYYSTLPNQWPI